MAQTLCQITAAPTRSPPPDHVAGTISFIPVERLRTDFAALRPGAPVRSPDDTAPFPLRVVPTPDGDYQLIDGFKRLTAWRAHGFTHVPVVVEPPRSSPEQKRLLLAANSPARTLTALDEARVVASLMNDDGLSPTAVARLLCRKPQWVARRQEIAKRLSPMAENALASGKLGPTVAHSLCAMTAVEQDSLLACITRHGLKLREALALVCSYRVADKQDRRALLEAPLDLLRPEPYPSPAASPALIDCEKRLESIRQALVSLADFLIPAQMAPAEKRRVEALHRSVVEQLHATAALDTLKHCDPKGDPDDREQPPPQPLPLPIPPGSEDRCPPVDPAGDREPLCLLRQQGDRPPRGAVAEDRASHPRGGGGAEETYPEGAREQAGALPLDDQRESGNGTVGQPDPARNPRAGLPRRTQHPGRLHPDSSELPLPLVAQDRQTPLRNPAG